MIRKFCITATSFGKVLDDLFGFDTLREFRTGVGLDGKEVSSCTRIAAAFLIVIDVAPGGRVTRRTLNRAKKAAKGIRTNAFYDGDIATIGFHMHFDQLGKDVELSLKPGTGLDFITTPVFSSAHQKQINWANSILTEAIQSPEFRQQLLDDAQASFENLQGYLKSSDPQKKIGKLTK